MIQWLAAHAHMLADGLVAGACAAGGFIVGLSVRDYRRVKAECDLECARAQHEYARAQHEADLAALRYEVAVEASKRADQKAEMAWRRYSDTVTRWEQA